MFVWKWKGEVKIEDEEETLIKQGIGKTGGGGLDTSRTDGQHSTRGTSSLCQMGTRRELHL
jgi:hypothetical protein